MSCRKWIQRIIVLCGIGLSGTSTAGIIEYHIADVTPSSFTVIFSNTTAVVSPDIKIYAYAQGDTELILPSIPFQPLRITRTDCLRFG
jgi:hypothetical protein